MPKQTLTIEGQRTGDVLEDNIFVTSGLLKISDPNLPNNGFWTLSDIPGKYGRLSLNAEGAWTYKLTNEAPVVQALKGNQLETDEFLIVWGDNESFGTIAVNVTGYADSATISGDTQKQVVASLDAEVAGTLNVSDLDAGEKSFQKLQAVSGSYGSLSLAADGVWKYSLTSTPSSIQFDSNANQVNDVFTIQTVDGTVAAIKILITPPSSGIIFQGGFDSDTFTSGSGNDAIDGGAGIDTVIYTANRANCILTKTSSGWSVSSSAHGTDTVQNVERLQFSDKKLALDLDPSQHTGQALEFIGLMAPALVKDPSIVGMILGYFDQGISLHDVCQVAIDVGLVNSIAGSGTDAALAAMAFRNVIGSEADAATIDMLVGYIDGRYASYTHAEFMTVISGMEVNQTHIGLIGLQQTGVEFF